MIWFQLFLTLIVTKGMMHETIKQKLCTLIICKEHECSVYNINVTIRTERKQKKLVDYTKKSTAIKSMLE